MTHEFFIICGLILGGFTVPSILLALKDGGAPRVPMIFVAVAGGLFLYGASQAPSGVDLTDLPAMFERVIRSLT